MATVNNQWTTSPEQKAGFGISKCAGHAVSNTRRHQHPTHHHTAPTHHTPTHHIPIHTHIQSSIHLLPTHTLTQPHTSLPSPLPSYPHPYTHPKCSLARNRLSLRQQHLKPPHTLQSWTLGFQESSVPPWICKNVGQELLEGSAFSWLACVSARVSEPFTKTFKGDHKHVCGLYSGMNLASFANQEVSSWAMTSPSNMQEATSIKLSSWNRKLYVHISSVTSFICRLHIHWKCPVEIFLEIAYVSGPLYS